MKQYLELLNKVLLEGEHRDDRTGVGTRAIFGYQMRFNLKDGFPLITTKKLHTKSIIHELLWFLKGKTNNDYLKDRGVSIWNEWAKPDGTLGPIYGAQWRRFSAAGTTATVVRDQFTPIPVTGTVLEPNGVSVKKTSKKEVCEAFRSSTEGVDQIKEVFESLKCNPASRRHLVVAWNPLQLDQMALPPCHCLFQFYVNNKMELSCQLYQRSCDVFLGLPFNIASYALLVHIFADCLGYDVGEFVWTGGDIHLYENHIQQASLQLAREPFRPQTWLTIKNHHKYPWEYEFEDFAIYNYQYHPAIPAPVAV